MLQLQGTHAVNSMAVSDLCRPLCNVRSGLVACCRALQYVAVYFWALSNVSGALSGVGAKNLLIHVETWVTIRVCCDGYKNHLCHGFC